MSRKRILNVPTCTEARVSSGMVAQKNRKIGNSGLRK